MKDLFNILINYWKPIVGLLFTIIGFIIALIKKKPVTDVLSDIFSWCLSAINVTEAESKFNVDLRGDLKLARATSLVLDWFKNKYPTIDTFKYKKVIEETIELILNCPQKKG